MMTVRSLTIAPLELRLLPRNHGSSVVITNITLKSTKQQVYAVGRDAEKGKRISFGAGTSVVLAAIP